MAKILHSKLKISLEFAVLKVIKFETVTQISRSINPDGFVDNMKKKHRSSKHMVFLFNANAETANSSERGCNFILHLGPRT